MQQIYEVKVVTLTRGGLADEKKKLVVTTNCKNVSGSCNATASHSTKGKKTWEGQNNHKSQVND